MGIPVTQSLCCNAIRQKGWWVSVPDGLVVGSLEHSLRQGGRSSNWVLVRTVQADHRQEAPWTVAVLSQPDPSLMGSNISPPFGQIREMPSGHPKPQTLMPDDRLHCQSPCNTSLSVSIISFSYFSFTLVSLYNSSVSHYRLDFNKAK